MSALQIDVPASRELVRRLRAVTTATGTARQHVATIAAATVLDREAAGALRAMDELLDEVGLSAQVLGLAADRAEAADTGDAAYGAMLDTWIAASLTTLRAGLNDAAGASVRTLLATAAPGAVPAAWAASLTGGAAADWLRSLPDAERIAIAAGADRFAGTAIGTAIRDWMATLEGEPLRAVYVARAMLAAGIDPDLWDPRLGLAANATTVEAVYEYYGRRYGEHTDRLWWAGMAALIGPSFYGGFQDIDTFRALLGLGDAIALGPLGVALPPDVARSSLSGSDLADELRWYQVRLLTMQREIFVDMAAAHEAYLDGGIDAIERFYVDDPYDHGTETIDAWRRIDTGWRTGDADAVASGNAMLLRREQQQVIADDYDAMRDRPGTGGLVTWAMTLVGTPSVPGARSYPEVFPLRVSITPTIPTIATPDRVPLVPILGPWSPTLPIPHATVEADVDLVTPLPDGNIAVFDDRWALIREDTLPTYVALARNHPDVVLEVLSTPIGERAEAFTIQQRIDDIARSLGSDWALDPELEVAIGW